MGFNNLSFQDLTEMCKSYRRLTTLIHGYIHAHIRHVLTHFALYIIKCHYLSQILNKAALPKKTFIHMTFNFFVYIFLHTDGIHFIKPIYT